MNSPSALSKLAELRSKTDRELSQMIANQLESALNLALRPHLDVAEPQRIRAERAYAEAAKLLPKVDDLYERRRLKNKLVQVRESLDRPSAVDELCVEAAG